jgi:hypothetical protein
MSRATSMGSSTLFGRASFLVPLPDASKSLFFFPMVMWRRAVVRVQAEVSVVWAMVGTMPVDF